MDVSTERIEHVIAHLNKIGKVATLDFARAVGRLIIEHFYAGDTTCWRNRDARKDASFRKLSRHPNLPMSAGALYRSVCIYEICERLGIRDWKHISTSHVRLVLPLPFPEQDRLLRIAEAHAWPVGRLDDEIAVTTRREPQNTSSKGGRIRHGNLRRAMRSVEQCSKVLDQLLDEETNVPIGSSPDSTRAAIGLLRETARKCAVLEARLIPTRPNASSIAPLPGDRDDG